jgi:ADP-ribose pyrophosphatase YjhB (NUDIX family)
MITFRQGHHQFNYRIVGVAVQQRHILLHQAEGEPFWTLPGGRAEFGEDARHTLKREMLEEIGATIEIIRLLWLVENFFNYDGADYHEIALYFLMHFPDDARYSGSFTGAEGELKLTYRWFPLNTELLSGLPLLPAFLQTSLLQLPETIEHIVQRDEYTWD